MGYIRHNAIVITSWNDEKIEEAAAKAQEIGLQILGPSPAAVNGYRSILVCPDGSKEGWNDSDDGDRRREILCDWLGSMDSLEWLEIAYGHDDSKASIESSAWMTPNAY